MKDQSAENIVKTALEALTSSNRFRSCVSGGSVHEEDFIGVFVSLINRAGLVASAVDLSMSNYPIEDRLLVNARPKDYKFVRKTFIEMDDHLFRIRLDWGQSGHGVDCFESRDAALAAQTLSHAEWTYGTEDLDGYAETILSEAVDLDAFVSNLTAAKMHEQTPAVRQSAKTARL